MVFILFICFGMVEFGNYLRKLFDFSCFLNKVILINVFGCVFYMGGKVMVGKVLKYLVVSLFL